MFGPTPVEEEAQNEALQALGPWQLGLRYHDLIRRTQSARQSQHIRQRVLKLLMERASRIAGRSASRANRGSATIEDLPTRSHRIEFDLEETLEHTVIRNHPEIHYAYERHRRRRIILTLDTSLSMNGEKFLQLGLVLLILNRLWAEDTLAIVVFENQARVLKRPDERLTGRVLLSRFLCLPARGYTHLEGGLRAACRLRRQGEARHLRPIWSTLLLTDGIYTAGKDPTYLAFRLRPLHVVKLDAEAASRTLCRDLARQGEGRFREATRADVLPQVILNLVRRWD